MRSERNTFHFEILGLEVAAVRGDEERHRGRGDE
jgi:hypothetical protein